MRDGVDDSADVSNEGDVGLGVIGLEKSEEREMLGWEWKEMLG